jgi:T4 bacteriophage base plate protein
MRGLSDQQILQVWERGQQQHPLDRALTLLAFALPESPWETLSQLSIGQRDALLLRLRQQMLGDDMESFAQCPHCGESVEFTLKTTALRVMEPSIEPLASQTLTVADYNLTFTLPNSQDLAAVVHCETLQTAQSMLTQRCIQHMSREGVAIAPESIPEEIWQDLEQQMTQQMAAIDPQAEILLDLSCPACQSNWQVLFDIVAFFWAELNVQAQQIMQDVHTLARSYGWRESDILAMSPTRRQHYLGLVEV